MSPRHALLALAVLLAAALPVRGEPLRSFDAVMDALDKPLSQGDMNGAFVVLASALRDARVGGWLGPDWAIFFAMQADFARLDNGNPAYALQLTEDGLELIAGDPDQADFATALQVSRAYALADLGRFDDAAATARLALSDFRRIFGDVDADDLAARAEEWAAGRLTDFNTAATDLARQALDKAYAADAEGAHGRAILLAAGAVLPLGTDLPEGAVRSINFEAELVIADALAALGRIGDSVAASRRALNHLTRQPWQPGQPVAWWPETWDADSRAVVFRALTEMAPRALGVGQSELGAAVLREAAGFADDSDGRGLLLLLQASMAFHSGDAGTALDLIAENRAAAAAAGDRDIVLMSDFYTAIVRARIRQQDGLATNATEVVAAAEAALAHAAAGGGISRLLVLSEAAKALSESTQHATALAYAREVLVARQADLAERRDTGFAQTQARLGARDIIETFLKTAHDSAGGLDPARAEACPPVPGFQSCVVVARDD